MLFTNLYLLLDIRKTSHRRSSEALTSGTSQPALVPRKPIRPGSRTFPSHPSPSSPSVRPLGSNNTVNNTVNNAVGKRMRKPSFALRESVTAQKKQKRQNPETAAMLANYDITIEDQEQQPPKKVWKKGSQKAAPNTDFFNRLAAEVVVNSRNGTSTFFQC